MQEFEEEVRRGDDVRLRVDITRDDVAVNIAGASFICTGKRWLNDDSYLFQISSVTVLNESGGSILITIPASESESFTDTLRVHTDVQMIESDGLKTTVAQGILIFKADVTR